MIYEQYRMVFLVFFIFSLGMLSVSVWLFFRLNVPALTESLLGIAEKRRIRQLQAEKDGKAVFEILEEICFIHSEEFIC